jgi:hypothetical protein
MGKLPTGEQWVSYINKFKKHFNSDAKPILIAIVNSMGEGDKVAQFRFPKPSGVSTGSYIKFQSSDDLESILKVFDKEGVHVWLQIQPGNNKLKPLAEIAFKQYGKHKCVKGLGIDLEWWYPKDVHNGKALSDSDAKDIVKYVRSINKDYTVFVKHWETEKMPKSYRDGLIFVDDSQGLHDKNGVKKTFSKWAEYFKDNPVWFQIGYNADQSLWKKNPIEFANIVKEAGLSKNKRVGLVWVDFTMKQGLEGM